MLFRSRIRGDGQFGVIGRVDQAMARPGIAAMPENSKLRILGISKPIASSADRENTENKREIGHDPIQDERIMLQKCRDNRVRPNASSFATVRVTILVPLLSIGSRNAMSLDTSAEA